MQFNQQSSQYLHITRQQALYFLGILKQQVQRQKQIQISVNKNEFQDDQIEQINFRGQQLAKIKNQQILKYKQLQIYYPQRKRHNLKILDQFSLKSSRNKLKQTIKEQTIKSDLIINSNEQQQQTPIKHKSAKNIIKNIINGFKKFPCRLHHEVMYKIVNKIPLSQNSIILQKQCENNAFGIRLIIKNQYQDVFKQKMYGDGETRSQKNRKTRMERIQKRNINKADCKSNYNNNNNVIHEIEKQDVIRQQPIIQFNKMLIQQIFKKKQLKQIFVFWLQQYAHYYIDKQSQIKNHFKAEHRSAIESLLLALGSNKVINPLNTLIKPIILKQQPGQKQYFLKCPIFKHQINNVFSQAKISKVFKVLQITQNDAFEKQIYYQKPQKRKHQNILSQELNIQQKFQKKKNQN